MTETHEQADRELLELAAKSVGVDGTFGTERLCTNGDWEQITAIHLADGWGWWNPLIDNGQALLLAVELRIEIRPGADTVTAAGDGAWVEVPVVDGCRDKATRRAIVLAAVEIWEAKQ